MVEGEDQDQDLHEDEPVINYYFPVRVEVVGALSDVEVQRIAEYVFGEFDQELTTRI
ncbi:hypothetical protein [Streptomyces sp. NPDC091215]|uniref:hypothetical protein n=1 Tax=Streptomyces sp. NPDC091215 TaxID=3155192 RepID=UPI00342A0463